MTCFLRAAMFLALAGLALADMRFTEKSKDEHSYLLGNGGEKKAPRTTTVALKGRKVKFSENDDPTAAPFRVSYFDGETGDFRDSNPRKKNFSVLTAAKMKERSDKAQARVKDLEGKLKLMSGEKKARTERYIWLSKKNLGQLPEPPKVELQRTGEKQKLGSFDCERVVIREADVAGQMQVVFDCWMTEQAEGWAAYADMYAAYKAFSPAVLEKMKEVKGFHVKGYFEVFWFEGDYQKTTFDNSDAAAGEVPDAEFQIPADYADTTPK